MLTYILITLALLTTISILIVPSSAGMQNDGLNIPKSPGVKIIEKFTIVCLLSLLGLMIYSNISFTENLLKVEEEKQIQLQKELVEAKKQIENIKEIQKTKNSGFLNLID